VITILSRESKFNKKELIDKLGNDKNFCILFNNFLDVNTVFINANMIYDDFINMLPENCLEKLIEILKYLRYDYLY